MTIDHPQLGKFGFPSHRREKRALLACLVVALIAICVSLLYPKHISGNQFKLIWNSTLNRSYGTWKVYNEDQTGYWIEYSGAYFYKNRFFVDKAQIEIKESKGGEAAESKYIGIGEITLKRNRYPGAKEESF